MIKVIALSAIWSVVSASPQDGHLNLRIGQDHYSGLGLSHGNAHLLVGYDHNNIGHVQDSIGHVQDSIGHGHGNIGHGDDNVGQGHDNIGQGHGNIGYGHDNIGHGLDSVNHEHGNIGNIQNGYETVEHVHDNTDHKHNTIGLGNNNVGHEQDTQGHGHAFSSQNVALHILHQGDEVIGQNDHENDEKHHEHHVDYHAHPKYEFEYKVHDTHTGDLKTQHETRDGDTVKGFYTLHEADGRTRIVEYSADKHTGFRASVKHEGHITQHQSSHE